MNTEASIAFHSRCGMKTATVRFYNLIFNAMVTAVYSDDALAGKDVPFHFPMKDKFDFTVSMVDQFSKLLLIRHTTFEGINLTMLVKANTVGHGIDPDANTAFEMVFPYMNVQIIFATATSGKEAVFHTFDEDLYTNLKELFQIAPYIFKDYSKEVQNETA